MSTKVKTGKVRFGYVNAFTPRAQGDEKDEKYSVMIIIDKKDKVTLSALKDAVEAAKEVGKEKSWGGKIPAKLTLPLRDGDEEKPDSPELAGKYFLNAKSKNKPGVVKIVNGSVTPIEDPAEFYSGCFGKAVFNLYPYSFNGNRGVGVGLNNLLFLEHGEPLAGGASAQEDFADEEGVEDESAESWME